MDWVKRLAIALTAVLIALMPMMECQEPFVPNRPLCISQLAIVNHACSMLPYSPLPPPAPPAPTPSPSSDEDEGGEDEGGDDDDDSGVDDEGSEDGGGGGSDDEDNNQRGRRHRHGHAPGHNHSNNGTHRSSHGQHHSRRHRHHQQESPIQEECCRWLKQIDSACVCQLLVHLPPFLAKPAHEYTVIVDESCSITFTCGGRLKLSE